MSQIKRKIYGLELEQASAKSRYTFGKVKYLAAKRIIGLEAFSVTDFGKAPSGNTMINANAFKSAFISLYIAGKEDFQNVALTTFRPDANNGVVRLDLDLCDIDFEKSFVFFPDTSLIVANESLFFHFHYLD